ncbi:hypothetical protein V3481_012900 [Fusarium oxysporum f. sp. vasinfectum]
MPPGTLNWLKDSDASWLHGPVQQGASKIYCMQTGPSGASLHQPNSLEDYPEEKEHITYHTAEAIVNIILTPAGSPSGPGEAERQPATKRAFL